MKRILLFLIYVFFAQAAICDVADAAGVSDSETGIVQSAPMVITLENALDIALQNNREIMAAKAQENAARNAAASAKGMYFPKIEAEGRYTRMNDPINIDLAELRTAIIGANYITALGLSGNPAMAAAIRNGIEGNLPADKFNISVQDEEFYNFTITAMQTIYAGGRIRAANIAKKAALNVAIRNTAAAREKAYSSATEGYFRLKLAERVSQIRREAREGIAVHDYNARQLYEQGMISHANRMRAQVALADAEREEKKSIRDMELAAMLLANVLSVETSSFTLTTDFALPEDPGDVQKYINKALASNSALNILEGTKEQLAAAKKAADGKRLPTVAAFGKYEAYKQDLTILEPDWAAGIVLKLPIFSGFSDYRESREIREKQQALDRIDENARQQISTLVRKHHHDILAAKEEYESLGKAQELAEENLRLNRLSFQHGTGTSLEVIDAQLALSKIKTDRSRALFDYAKAKAELKMVCGE